LIEITISLAQGDETGPGEVFDGLRQVPVFPQQDASQIEPLGFPGIAGAGDMTHKYVHLCDNSRTQSSLLGS
jgi:hypothetical protein